MLFLTKSCLYHLSKRHYYFVYASPKEFSTIHRRKKNHFQDVKIYGFPKTLTVVSEYINDHLNPSKHNIYDHTREDYEQAKSMEEILDLLHISVDEYYYYFEISEDDDFQIHLRRQPNFCFVSNDFKIGLSTWQANKDIQPVFNEHKASAYIYAYLSKSEESCSYEMKQALKISLENKENSYEQIKTMAQAYASNQECSVHEALYHCLQELWLRNVILMLINIPENRFKILCSQNEIIELLDESEDIFKKNIFDRYMDRPDKRF